MGSTLAFQQNDGGRQAAGFKGSTGDCVVRSIAIASGRSYAEIYDFVQAAAKNERKSKRGRTSNARNGVQVRRKWFKEWMRDLGFEWIPKMTIGSGCTMHLAAGEVPSEGRYVVSLSGHYTALIDGVIHDTYDPQRETMIIDSKGTRTVQRCVYGFWHFVGQAAK